MLNIQSTPGDSSAIPADTDPTPSTSYPEQQSASTIRTPVHTTKDAQQPLEPFHHFSSLNLSAEAPGQDDIPSPTTTISEEDSDNIAETSTMSTHSEDVSLETPLTERNPRRQETMGDGDAEDLAPRIPQLWMRTD
ncbi:hypothetical protein L1987_40887 [Smallanthus sonchifolius]|uniref:Uncharacterized protein n=1 Tax=Smallanthus sonchifolius TaxID=185202 RepID=A0ACB9GUV0_9ASTR|nr:hypothetical protein L1987_40887 [Smallanthus sonchifolius]